MQSLEASELAIPFKGAFKHASAERHAMQSLWVRAYSASGAQGFGEGCPREYVTAESMSTALAFVDRHRAEWITCLRDVHSLREWVSAHQLEIDVYPAAWTAVELALLDLFGKLNACALEPLLELPALNGRFRYTAVIGDGPSEQFATQLRQFLKAGFNTFKIKLAPDMQANHLKVRALVEAGITADAVRADANNLWRDAKTCVAELKSLRFSFTALEEPLQAGDFRGLDAVAIALNTRIILDESIARRAQLDQIPSTPGRWIINCRVSKMGGLLRALPLLHSAQSRGLGIIVGAHVGETSVLTRAALTLARAAGPGLVAQEGAFGTHLLTRDVADPPLMFGVGGVIDVAEAGLAIRPGLGLKIAGAAAS
ncbi:MAG TPA: enolase C-terminal domain-like protein [Steroidobacteraceae bacterium]|nr:enolase C-terminal domain-like protein [Steroidobacteraceae bacterium]